MPISTRHLAILLVVALVGCGLSACGTINEKLAAGLSDVIPQWAGGLPSDAPPRPGTAKYDEFMRAREEAFGSCASEGGRDQIRQIGIRALVREGTARALLSTNSNKNGPGLHNNCARPHRSSMKTRLSNSRFVPGTSEPIERENRVWAGEKPGHRWHRVGRRLYRRAPSACRPAAVCPVEVAAG